jgi:FkbM family methyltransferase
MINFSEQPSHALMGRICRYPLRMLPRNLVVPILRGTLRGKKWIVGSQRHAFWLGSYEIAVQHCIAREVKPQGVFYDIGANVGFYSLFAATLIGSGKVFAFEPVPANIVYLRKHLHLNGITNVSPLELAVCDQIGKFFFAVEDSGSMGRLQPDGALEVETTTLDALIQEQRVPPPTYVKMDIEGAELKALLGAKACFARYQPKLFLSTHGEKVHEECCQLLRSWNFTLHPIGKPTPDRAEIFATLVA